jgi:hypothetical protein
VAKQEVVATMASYTAASDEISASDSETRYDSSDAGDEFHDPDDMSVPAEGGHGSTTPPCEPASTVQSSTRTSMRGPKPNSFLNAAYHVPNVKDLLTECSPGDKPSRTRQFRSRLRARVADFDESMLLPGNKYGLNADATNSFKVGQRVCIKDFYLDSSKPKEFHC